MIPFEEIDARLEALCKDRKWLAEASGRKLASINVALAPNADAKNRSSLLQKALSDAIEREEAKRLTPPAEIPQSHLVVRVEADEFESWSRAALSHGQIVTDWAVEAIRAAYSAEMAAKASEKIITFPEIPLFHSAAGLPIDSDVDIFAPTRELGPGRFAVQLHGDSMAPRFPDHSIIIMRERASLKRPLLKKGEIYLFVIDGEKTVKSYDTRPATAEEIESGLSYISPTDGSQKVIVLKSLNRAYSDIIATEPLTWLGWLDKGDNQ